MVKKYEPCQKYYPYEDEPTLEMRDSKDGKYVKLETYNNEMARMTAQVNRQTQYIANLEAKMAEIQAIVGFRLKSQPKRRHQKLVDKLVESNVTS